MELNLRVVQRAFFEATKQLYNGAGIPEGFDYTLPAPISTNRLWHCTANGRMIKTEYAKRYQAKIVDLYYEKGWYRMRKFMNVDFAALMIYYPKIGKVAMDTDNITKIVLDTFEKLRIINNDRNLKYLVCAQARPIDQPELKLHLRSLELSVHKLNNAITDL